MASREFAAAAVAHGSIDALEYLINQIDQPVLHVRGFGSGPSPRRVVLRAIDFSGTNAEIKDWFDKNIGQLHFDKRSRKFIVLPEAA